MPPFESVKTVRAEFLSYEYDFDMFPCVSLYFAFVKQCISLTSLGRTDTVYGCELKRKFIDKNLRGIT